MEKCPASGGHVFKATKTIFELIQDIIGTNFLTKFHDDQKINVTSRVLTRFYYSHIMKIAPPLLGPYIIGMNYLTEFHEDRTINVASRVKNALPLGGHVIKIGQKINVASRVLTRKNAPPPGGHIFQPTGIIFKLVQDIIGMNLLTQNNAPPLGSHIFQANVTIFEHIQDIIETNLLIKFHEVWTINVASRE
ncbi:hypothetical protein DPMN_069439 [Dreissena polymorpha]|uniref:Uncharacterized protein n=1 Tax=Dreissena polymorpha TaxID=45954 RepID=A0A9D3YZ07_DREPO|nr:hypothetical protein DPMN_069439 [Dreissena polymorpha]